MSRGDATMQFANDYDSLVIMVLRTLVNHLSACLFVLLAISSHAAAENVIPSGYCAIVVASRQTISEARDFIEMKGYALIASVFESSNGWYAISLGNTLLTNAKSQLSRQKSAGEIPEDSYCSIGKRYVRAVEWRKETAKPNAPNAHGNLGGTGSGFVVSETGHVLTNAHVVEGCSSIEVNDQPANILARSEVFDLALIEANGSMVRGVASFSGSPAKLNSDVTVFGFPYSGLLRGLNVTRGSVSSLQGISGDAITMQITAPVQPGNSGGPVVASDGSVVGVVVARLNEKLIAELFGSAPQNVNFAVRSEIAKLFLSQNSVDPFVANRSAELSPVDLAALAGKYTVFVQCDP